MVNVLRRILGLASPPASSAVSRQDVFLKRLRVSMLAKVGKAKESFAAAQVARAQGLKGGNYRLVRVYVGSVKASAESGFIVAHGQSWDRVSRLADALMVELDLYGRGRIEESELVKRVRLALEKLESAARRV